MLLVLNMERSLTGTSDRHYAPNNEDAEERDAARALISRRLTQIRGVVDIATATLSSDHNVFLPLYRLPDELLVEIFRFLAVEQLMKVTLVSKRLRSVALSAHHLWSTINVPLSPANQARLLVQRSGKTGIKLCVKQVGTARRRTGFRLRQIPIPRLSSWTVDEFTAVADRIEYLDGVVGPAAYLSHQTLSLKMPRLRILVLRGSPRRLDHSQMPEVPYPLFAGSASLLRVILLSTIHPAWNDPIFANLSHLCIHRPETRPTIMELGVILDSCQHLQNLELFNVLVPPTSSDPTKFCLPSLKWLHVSDIMSNDITSFLYRLQLPREANVKVHSPDYDALAAFGNSDAPQLEGLAGMTSLRTNLILPSHVTIGGASPSGALFSYHVGPDANDVPAWEFDVSPEPTTDFFTAADKAPVPWKSIERLHIGGDIGDSSFCEELLYRCSKIRELVISPYAAHNAELILRVLGPRLCGTLERLAIARLADDQTQSLVDFLEGRHSGGNTCAIVYLHIGRLEGQVPDEVLDRINMAVEFLVIGDEMLLRGTNKNQDKTTIGPEPFSYTSLGIPPWDDTFYRLDVEFPYNIR